ncbi:MAG: ABC transporter substrate-binding protein [Deltaproteobacteria bacterium]|nr:ABC transporter substrate-binding protein [Deltaproteobacteria bacterium]
MKYCPICGKEVASGDVCPADGAVLIQKRPGVESLVGTVLKGTYRVEEQIGEGGMGAVFRAVQMPLGRDVAIKVLLPALESTPSMTQRFFQEAKALSQLSHPHVVSIIDFGNTEDGMIYMVMEFLQGSTLGEVVPQGTGLSVGTTVRLMRQICSGVGAAHRCHLVHRDLKPENIFVATSAAASEVVKILDFGIARALGGQGDTRLTQTGLIMGTPGFLAPEQINSAAEADSRSDIYALGAILYFMLTGQRPYHGQTPQSILAQQLQEPPSVDLGKLGDRRPLARVVLEAMNLDPEARFQTTEEIVEALEEAAGAEELAVANARPKAAEATSASVLRSNGGRTKISGSSPMEPTELVGAVRSPRSRLPWKSFAIVLGVVTVLVAAFFLWKAKRDFPRQPRSGFTPVAAQARGVTADRITVGMSAVFSGPSRELGRGMQLGIQTFFSEVNEKGGIHGRELHLVALDDGYEPSRAATNMVELLMDRKVFAVLGNVGTPTAEVTLPLALEQGTPFFGAFTGADLLRREPPNRHVFNFRASYAEETSAIVEHFLDGLGFEPSEIAVFAQEDGFGDAGFRGVEVTLRERGYTDSIPRLGYRRNTVEVEDAVERLWQEHRETRGVVIVATYRAAAAFIRQTRDRGSDAVFASLSFVGSRAFAEELRELGPNYLTEVIVTQVVPHFDSPESGVARYRQLLGKHFPSEQPGFVSLEGYLAAQVFVEALERAGSELTVEGFVGAAESISGFDLGIGTPIEFGPDRHQGSKKVWGTVLDASGKYQKLDLGAGD